MDLHFIIGFMFGFACALICAIVCHYGRANSRNSKGEPSSGRADNLSERITAIGRENAEAASASNTKIQNILDSIEREPIVDDSMEDN